VLWLKYGLINYEYQIQLYREGLMKYHRDNWRILLIDDDEEDYFLTHSMLNKANGKKINLEWAQSYELGREKLQNCSYDAVLVDYDLRGRTGINLIREMSAKNYPTPLILYTGGGSYEVDMEAMEAGATLYLAKKEATPLLLERLIRYAIERKQHEAALERSARLDAYRLSLSDALRPLHDPEEIQGTASRILGEHLNANRVFYGEVDDEYVHVVAGYFRGVDSYIGTYRLEEFNSLSIDRLRKGEKCIVTDINQEKMEDDEQASCQEREIRAYVSLSLIKEGRIAAVLAVHQDEPRAWTEEEISLMEETAERTWSAVDRARAEQMMRSTEDRYSAMMDSIDEGFCIVQMEFDESMKPVDYYILENNRAFEHLTGLHNAQGKSVRKMSPNLEEHWYQTYGRVALTGEAFRFENLSKPMGRWFSVYAFPVGKPEEYKVGILFTDITTRKNIEAMLADYMHQLKESNQALRDFAFMAAHDLREPLRKVQSFSNQLLFEVKDLLTEKQLEYLERIHQANERMTSMLNGLLDYSKVTTYGESFQETNLKKVVDEVCQDLEIRLQETKGKITVDDLPNIQADPGQMHQLFLNLLGNALKYHRPQVPPHVRVYYRSSNNNYVEIVVADNGTGFSMEDAERVFKPFHRLVSKKQVQGTGMGLAICKKIIDRHGGKIFAESKPGEGAKFVVMLKSSRG
jgi:signal transduction histidine kinase/DNA-binding response OmpR family regulator